MTARQSESQPLYPGLHDLARTAPWRSHYYAYAAERIARALAGARDPLDFGAGLGHLAEAVARRLGARATCVDVDPACREACRRRGFETASAPSVDARHDAAWSNHVLEHVADDVAAARRMLRALRPGAPAIVLVPAHPRLWSAHDRAVGHYRRYTRARLCATLRGAGFTIERVEYGDCLGAVALTLLHPFVRTAPGYGAAMHRSRDQAIRLSRHLDRAGARRLTGIELCALARRPHGGR